MKSSVQSDLDYRINRARLAGANCMYSQAEFKNYLLEIGLNKYEKSILPLEQEDYSGAMAEEPQTKGEIIPFPGVTLTAPDDDFQTQLDGFLREMGYIE